MSTIELPQFGYRYIPGPFQYSAGVAALTDFAIERIRFGQSTPLDEGFQRIEHYIKKAGLPLTAFCACELRSPAPFSEEGFRAFNRIYVNRLERWGIVNNDVNPVARSNVCPERSAPQIPSFHAFSLAVPSASAAKSFVVAGSGEAQEGAGSYSDQTVRYRDTSADAIKEKAIYVLGQMERRMEALNASWLDTTAVQVYTIHDLHPFFGDEIVKRGAARHGLTWHFSRPPVVHLEYEMDCRGIQTERMI